MPGLLDFLLWVACVLVFSEDRHDSLAERSKAVAQGAIPKGRGFEPHSCHFPDSFLPRDSAGDLVSARSDESLQFSITVSGVAIG